MHSSCHPFVVFIFVVINVVLILSEDVVKQDDDISKDVHGRAIRDDFIKHDQWKAVEEHQIENGGWKAADESRIGDEKVIEGQTVKRRRLRKRKRRPQVVVDGETIYEPRPRRRRPPVRLDENREVWQEMESEDAIKRPYSRRRISPIYQQGAPVQQVQGTVSASLKFSDSDENISYEKIRDPYIAFQEAEEKIRLKKLHQTSTTNAPTTLHDLKTLLKQSGGRLNLSELLQQRNLSLSDLLKGKQQAISVLTEKPEITDVISEYKNPMEINADQEKPLANDFIVTTSQTALDEQRKRFSMLYANKASNIYSDVTKYDVVTEATTEKRIFVPSHPSYYTSLVYKPDLLEATTTVIPEIITIVTTPESVSPQENIISKLDVVKSTGAKLPKHNPKLPITSAILHKTVKKQQLETPKIPLNAIKIDINELLAMRDVASIIEKDDGPLKMTFNLDELVVETTTEIEATTIEDTVTKRMQDKLQTVSAKDEIMEILKDEETKDHLSKILELRNMTVEELVEQRERGSSQRHLADIFHNSTREPVPKGEHVIGEIKLERSKIKMGQTKIEHGQMKKEILGEIKKTIDPLEEGVGKDIERKAKSTSDFGDIKNLLLDVSEELITSERIPGTSFPTYKIETHERETIPRNIPIWKTIYPSVFNEPVLQKDTYQKEMQKIEEIEKTVAKAVNEDYVDITNNNDYDDYVKLPIGVKSAIFASLAIVGMSLLVFLTILLIFKWTQKHKTRLGYSGSFACSSTKIKSPILQSEQQQKRSFRTMMHETLGRKKGYYKSHMQSMSDPWENDGKPYQ